MTDHTLLNLTADIVAAHVSNNSVTPSDLPALIANVYGALAGTAAPVAIEAPKLVPAVSVRSSVKPDHLVCLEDGKKLTMLKRYLATNFSLTPDEYRAKWGLPKDYPMVAPNYAERRRSLAHAIGLGRKSRGSSEVEAPPVAPLPKARRKLGIASAKTIPGISVDSQIENPDAVLKPARKARAKLSETETSSPSSGE